MGHSALFTGENFFEVPFTFDFNTRSFSVTFWVFLNQDAGQEFADSTQWCPLFQKGKDRNSDNVFNRAPAVYYNLKTRAVRVYISTTNAGATPEGETVESQARIPVNRWTHVAVIREEKKVRIYINGMLDVMGETEGLSTYNQDSLFIGGKGEFNPSCRQPFYIDDFKFYGRELRIFEIESEASLGMNGIELSAVILGCLDCSVEEAARACGEGYHLCTSMELHTGGYQVSRAMGWTDISTNVWSHSSLMRTSDSSGGDESGIGLCCSDLN